MAIACGLFSEMWIKIISIFLDLILRDVRCDLYRISPPWSVLSLITLGMRNELQCHMSHVTPAWPLIGQYPPTYQPLIGLLLTSYSDPSVICQDE